MEKAAHGDDSLDQKLDLDDVNLPMEMSCNRTLQHWKLLWPVPLSHVYLYLSSTSFSKPQQPLKEDECWFLKRQSMNSCFRHSHARNWRDRVAKEGFNEHSPTVEALLIFKKISDEEQIILSCVILSCWVLYQLHGRYWVLNTLKHSIVVNIKHQPRCLISAVKELEISHQL